jgi:hypothetical protein
METSIKNKVCEYLQILVVTSVLTYNRFGISRDFIVWPRTTMPPTNNLGTGPRLSARLIYSLYYLASTTFSKLNHGKARLQRREEGFDPHSPTKIVFAVLIPVLVLLSGLFAGLTLGCSFFYYSIPLNCMAKPRSRVDT